MEKNTWLFLKNSHMFSMLVPELLRSRDFLNSQPLCEGIDFDCRSSILKCNFYGYQYVITLSNVSVTSSLYSFVTESISEAVFMFSNPLWAITGLSGLLSKQVRADAHTGTQRGSGCFSFFLPRNRKRVCPSHADCPKPFHNDWDNIEP